MARVCYSAHREQGPKKKPRNHDRRHGESDKLRSLTVRRLRRVATSER